MPHISLQDFNLPQFLGVLKFISWFSKALAFTDSISDLKKKSETVEKKAKYKN
jgi:hypothetical protein